MMRLKVMNVEPSVFAFAFIFVLNFCLFWKGFKSLKDEKDTQSHSQDNKEPLYEESLSLKRITKVNSKEKMLLMWTGFNGPRSIWKKVFKRLLLNECEENRCFIELRRENVEKADAILFNIHDLHRHFDNRNESVHKPHPSTRSENQIYVFFSQEAPNVNSYENIKWEEYKNFFNWTMTYRTDSDVFVPFGKIQKRIIKKKVSYISEEELKRKEKALAMVSHCPTSSRREELIQQMNNHMKIDVYGACGNKRCGNPAYIYRVNTMKNESCNNLYSNYAFFLAFENSLCKDYVTEKLFRSLKLGVLPVVFGGADYNNMAPPNSFINVNQFQNYANLVKYLLKVSDDHILYNSYLRWQEDYDVEIGSPFKPFICDLCKKLHSKRTFKSYPDIRQWFFENKNCL
ncbi:UNVERIFIED_CONTAM: hypothetical protein RMT77_008448 [Armadillidium vulgare]